MSFRQSNHFAKTLQNISSPIFYKNILKHSSGGLVMWAYIHPLYSCSNGQLILQKVTIKTATHQEGFTWCPLANQITSQLTSNSFWPLKRTVSQNNWFVMQKFSSNSLHSLIFFFFLSLASLVWNSLHSIRNFFHFILFVSKMQDAFRIRFLTTSDIKTEQL